MTANRRTRLGLADWIERHIVLHDSVAEPGPIRLAPTMRAIADAIGDPAIERVSVLKSARVGFSTLLTAAVGYHATIDPCAMLMLLPTQDDTRDFVVSDLEPLFDASPKLRGRLSGPKVGGDRINRNTLTHRLFKGGSIKVVAGKAPRNLRRHTARILLVDEADAIEASAEGDPISLAERRTMTFANRKIITGGTPLDESTSAIARLYGQSDQRVFEVPCPECGAFAEIKWADIEWPSDRPELAAWRCPSCGALIDEKHKAQAARSGRWFAQKPEVSSHAGFRINSLSSLLPQASWPKLAAEFLRAKDDSDTLRVFVNTTLGEPWREQGEELEESALAARVESFSLDAIPREVLAITVGADVQGDRIEASIVGHGRDGTAFILAHQITYGSPLDEDTWAEFDKVLRQRWAHPGGGKLKIDAAVIDAAGSAGFYEAVVAFCNARMSRRILAGKGGSGFARPAIQSARTKKGRLFIVGVDPIKQQIISRLSRGQTVRFSHTLEATYFEQLASERRVVRMARGRPMVRFERKPGYAAETLDCFVYALAAKAALSLSAAAFEQRETELRSPVPPTPPPRVHRSQWMQR